MGNRSEELYWDEIGVANASAALDYSKRDFGSLYEAVVAHRDNVRDTTEEYGPEAQRVARNAFDEFIDKRVSVTRKKRK